jgi:hypothetical protein
VTRANDPVAEPVAAEPPGAGQGGRIGPRTSSREGRRSRARAGSHGFGRRDLLRLFLAAALLARAVLGFADALALAGGGMRALPFGLSVGLGGTSALWSTLLAVLALLGSVGLLLRSPVGWILSVGACVAYLASGIGDIGLVGAASPIESPGFVVLFVANVVVPSVAVVGLLQVRTACLPVARLPFAFGLQSHDDDPAVTRRD